MTAGNEAGVSMPGDQEQCWVDIAEHSMSLWQDVLDLLRAEVDGRQVGGARRPFWVGLATWDNAVLVASVELGKGHDVGRNQDGLEDITFLEARARHQADCRRCQWDQLEDEPDEYRIARDRSTPPTLGFLP